MTEQDKLEEFLNDWLWIKRADMKDIAKAIIQRYPQILAEKVFEGKAKEIEIWNSSDHSKLNDAILYDNEAKNIEVFIREVKE